MTDAAPKGGPQYHFAEFVLDVERASLRKAGQEVKLRPKVYDALRYLLENRGRLISKEELIHALWPESFVTEDSLVQCLVELRRALGDQEQAILKTVPRRGYLFAAVVESGTAQAIPSHGLDSEQTRPELLTERVEASPQRLAGRSSLPLPRTPLIGRERELPAVKQLLLDPTVRLVTLTGTGGCGKTRLGLQVAEELTERFAAKVYFVALASIGDPTLVPAAIAESAGIRQIAGRSFPDLLKEFLRESGPAPMMFFLDNFEHILPASSLVVELLEASGSLKVLVSSRAALRVYGEHEFPVPPLALPDPQQMHSLEALLRNPALALFSQRAAAVKPDFTLNAENGPVVAEICSRVDGLPLAIELAAARIKMLPPRALLGRLQSRLQFLTAGPRDLPERQQTLRNTIDWSYGLLNDAEQKLLRRLSVFLGGCTLEAAEAVCNTRYDLGGDIFEVMASLVDKSLIRQSEPEGGEPRFAMLETIREYALERLGDSGEEYAARRAHAAYCLVLAEEGNPELSESERAQWLARCELEHDNFRSALDWLVEKSETDWAFRLCLALCRFWEMGEHLAEGRYRLEAVRNLDYGPHAKERARVAHFLSVFTTVQGDYEAAGRFAREGLEIQRELHDEWGVAVALNALAIVARDSGDYPAAQYYFEETLTLCRRLGDRVSSARCLHNLANVVAVRGDYHRARDLLQQSASIFQQLGDRAGAAWSLNQEGDVAREQGELAVAWELYEEALAIFRAAGDRWGTARSLTDLGWVACDQGNYGAADSVFRQALGLFQELGHKRGIARVLEGFAHSACAQGEARRALTLAGSAASLRRRIGAQLTPAEQVKMERCLQPARQLLQDTDAQAAWESGWALPFEKAIQNLLTEAKQ